VLESLDFTGTQTIHVTLLILCYIGKEKKLTHLEEIKMALTEPIRDPKQVQALLNYYKELGETRNQLLITIALHTALRISDILKLRCADVYDFTKKRVRTQITLTEKKTGKSKIVALHKNICKVLQSYLSQANFSKHTPLIVSTSTDKAISRIQAHRIISSAADAVGILENVSCHSLRKTFGYHAWKDGISPAVIMEIYNHSSLAVTRRYLGVTQSDINIVYMGLNFAN
jgi:integrase